MVLQILLHEAHQELSPELTLDEWLEIGCKCPTFAYWIHVMKLEATLLTFVRAHREGNYDLYVVSLHKLAEDFFAFDHYHYARWVPIHVEDMKRLPNSVFGEFRNGRFSVTRSNKRFSAIAIDQSHEQLNKKLKGTGGIIGLTQDPVSLMNWSVSGPEVSKLIEEFQVASEADEIDRGFDFFHHDETAKRQSNFVSDVRSMAGVIRLHNNPFLDSGNELISLHGQISEDKDSVFVIMERGREQ